MRTSQYEEALKKLDLDLVTDETNDPLVMSLTRTVRRIFRLQRLCFLLLKAPGMVVVFVRDELGRLWGGDEDVEAKLIALGFSRFNPNDYEIRRGLS